MCGKARIKVLHRHRIPSIKDMEVRMLIPQVASFITHQEDKAQGLMEAVGQDMVRLLTEAHPMEGTNNLISLVRTDGELNKPLSTNL